MSHIGPRIVKMLAGIAHVAVRAYEGAYGLVFRLYVDLAPYQAWRELLQNAMEANATRVEISRHEPSWTAKSRRKRMVSDNGDGMDPPTLAAVTANLAASGKEVGLTKNIGVGAKIALLPWNKYGLVYVSLRDGQIAMAWVQVDETTKTAYFRDLQADAGLTPLVVDGDGKPVVFAPGIVDGVDWAQTLPSMTTKAGHGTSVVLLGNDAEDNTLVGDLSRELNSETTNVLVDYLDSRYFRLRDGLDIVVQRFETSGALQHAASVYGFLGKIHNFVTRRGVQAQRGTVAVTATVDGQDVPADVHWILLDEKRTDGSPVRQWLDKGANAKHMLPPWVGLVYANEVFDRVYLKNDRRRDYLHLGYAGITYKEVQQHVYLFIEPRGFDESAPSDAGVAMDTGRKSLSVYQHGVYLGEVPVKEWLGDFARHMPKAIKDRINAAAAASKTAALDDDVFISDLYAEAQKIRVYLAKPGGKHGITPDTRYISNGKGDTPVGPGGAGSSGRKGKGKGKRRGVRETSSAKATDKRAKVLSLSRTLTGSVEARAIDVFKSTLPRVEPVDADTFCEGAEEDKQYLARWQPGVEGDPGVILINTDDPMYIAFLDVVTAEAGSAPWCITDPNDIADMRWAVFKRAAIAGVVGALVREMTDGLADNPLAVTMTCVGDATLLAHLRRILDLRRPTRRKVKLAS